jgi:hypothetical protein
MLLYINWTSSTKLLLRRYISLNPRNRFKMSIGKERDHEYSRNNLKNGMINILFNENGMEIMILP